MSIRDIYLCISYNTSNITLKTISRAKNISVYIETIQYIYNLLYQVYHGNVYPRAIRDLWYTRIIVTI